MEIWGCGMSVGNEIENWYGNWKWELKMKMFHVKHRGELKIENKDWKP